MVKSEMQENIKVELTKAEFDLISISIILTGDILHGDLDTLPQSIMLLKLGRIAGLYNLNTVERLANKFKALLKE